MIRLLTFSRCSLLREDRSCLAAIASAVASLSTMATSFDCHLLQRAAGCHPLDALGSARQQQRLQSTVADGRVHVVVVTPCEFVSSEFPEWLNVSVRQKASPGVVTELFSRRVAASEKTALEWFHLEMPASEDRSHWTTAALEAAAVALSECPNDMLIVTAIAGEMADQGRFESLLWEGVVRVPLWIGEGVAGSGRVNRPTGSFDVLETVLTRLNAADGLASTDQPVNLQAIYDQPSDAPPRLIRISLEDCKAVRTPDFLFVRSQSEEFGEKTALYGKPHDVWNVHDLSREFPDVADDLLAKLQAEAH